MACIAKITIMIEIREFHPDEIDLYMQIRLEALETNPHAFGSTAVDFKRQPRTFYQKRLQNNYESADIVMLVALDKNRPIGMMGVVRNSHPKRLHTATVTAVFVSPAYRGQGIASRMLDQIVIRSKAMDGLEQLYLSVVSDNHPAIALYKSRGFIRYGHAPRVKKWENRYFDDDFMVLYF